MIYFQSKGSYPDKRVEELAEVAEYETCVEVSS